MLATNIFGSYEFADLIRIPVLSLTEGDIYAALQEFAAAESAALDLLISSLADFGSNVSESFGAVSGGQLQKVGEGARGEATRRGGKYTVEFPIEAFEDRKIYTPEYLEEATLADLNADVVDAAIKDINTVFTAVFNSFTAAVNYIHDDDPWPGSRTGAHTVRRLANNDGQVGSAFANGALVPLATTNNYKVSGTAGITYGAFTTIRDVLKAQGHGGDIVYICSLNDASTIPGLLTTNFIRVPDVKLSILPTTQVPIVESPRAIGRVADAGELQAWPHWPDGYLFGFDRSKPKPVRIRQHADAAKRGFRLVADETRGGERPGRPLVNKYWQRIFGAGVRNRFNGVMMKITTGAYTDPVVA